MKTIGEQRVRIDFNVSGDSQIDNFKKISAELINKLEDMRNIPGTADVSEFDKISEYNRLISLAQTAYEEACMWAVKAITF